MREKNLSVGGGLRDIFHIVAGEFSADSDNRASSDLVVIIVVLHFDVDLHLQRWNVAEDFVQLVELLFWKLKKGMKRRNMRFEKAYHAAYAIARCEET